MATPQAPPPPTPTPLPAQGASTSDVLTALKNLVIAVNNLAQNYLNVNGALNAANLSATTVVKGSAGRIASISVTTAGAAFGYLYDGATATSLTKPIYIIPEAVGLYVVNLPVSFGILYVPGPGGMHATVSYS